MPALAKQAPSSQTMPVMWNRGARAKYTAPSGSGCPVTCRTALWVSAPCGFMAPLGVPLVPEV